MRRRRDAMGFIAICILFLAHFGNPLAASNHISPTNRAEVGRIIDTELLIEGDAVATDPGDSRSPGLQLGDTYWEMQQIASMGRQVSYRDGNQCHALHFVWTDLPCGGGDRAIKYNSYQYDGFGWLVPPGPGSGQFASGINGGFCNLSVAYDGSAVTTHHAGPETYQHLVFAARDDACHMGLFDWGLGAPPPPNCQGWVTGESEATSRYIWPKCEYDEIGSDQIVHVVATEMPPFDADPLEHRTLVYYRNVYPNGVGTIQYPACGTAIDSVHTLSAIVRENPLSDEVAIVWLRPIHYNGDPTDPCGFPQFQNDLYVMKSPDGGLSWDPGSKMNITDYTQGGTISIDECEYLAFTDLSAMYASDGILHIVWNTPLRDIQGYDPCTPLLPSRIWHWDDMNQCISLVYDALTPSVMCGTGAWNVSTSKVNISECDGNVYCSFTRFGAHTTANGDTSVDCSDGGYENGDIFLVGSADGGLTWGEATNLTNTQTDICPPGDCESEHWASMAMRSTGELHIEYIEDRDAGAYVYEEGSLTCNPVRYLSHPCFTIDPYCDLSFSPTEFAQPLFIAPNDGSPDCTSDITRDFDLTLTNIGNQSTSYNVIPNAVWLTGGGSGSIQAGCGNTVDIGFTVGPILDEGIYSTTIDITACGGAYIASIDVSVYVFCYFYLPEYEVLSTACWSLGVWNNARAGTASHDSPDGNMYWFTDEISMLYDESIVISYADDTCRTWMSIYDGTDEAANLVALGGLTTASFPSYEYAHGMWGVGDTSISGEIEYYMPNHPDTCLVIERLEVCNSSDESAVLNIGEAMDWDIPDGEGTVDNQCGFDADRKMFFIFGPPGTPEEQYFGGASFCHYIPGGAVLTNSSTTYLKQGYDPCMIGGLIARQNTFDLTHPDSIQDLNVVYAVDQGVVLAPGQCTVYCKVKASSLTGLADLLQLIDRGKEWIEDRDLDCPGCGQPPWPDCMNGDANGSESVDFDDLIMILSVVFLDGSGHTDCADADGDCDVDLFDAVYLIDYIFTGGPLPVAPGCENPPLYQDAETRDVLSVASSGIDVSVGESFSVQIELTNDELIWGVHITGLFFAYESGEGVLTCDSITYDGTRLDGAVLPNRSFSHNGFESAEGGSLFVTLEAVVDADTLEWGSGPLANVWFTATSEGAVDIAYAGDDYFLRTAALVGGAPVGQLLPFNPQTDFGSIYVGGGEFLLVCDDVFVATPAGSHPFTCTVIDPFGEPYDDPTDMGVTIVNDGRAVTPCETETTYPALSPVDPNGDNGTYTFFLAAGGSATACSATVSVNRQLMMTVPVKFMDTDGDLMLSFDEFDETYGDFDGDGDVDDNDEYIFNDYVGQMCTGDPCASNMQSIWYDPRDNLEAGDTINVYMTYSNNMRGATVLEDVDFYATASGYGSPEYLYGSTFGLNQTISAGKSYTLMFRFEIPDSGLGCLIFRGTATGCTDSFHVEICPKVVAECDPGVTECYPQVDVIRKEAWVFTAPPSEPIGWEIIEEPDSGVVYGLASQIWVTMCHRDPTFAKDSLIYTVYLCDTDEWTPDCTKMEFLAVVDGVNGDANCDCFVDIDDVTCLISYVFSVDPICYPCTDDIGDADGSCEIDIDDIVYLINYIFLGGDPPKLCPDLDK